MSCVLLIASLLKFGRFGSAVDHYPDAVTGSVERVRDSCGPCTGAVALLDHVLLISCDGSAVDDDSGGAEYALERATAAVARNLFARGDAEAAGADDLRASSERYAPPIVRTAVISYTSVGTADDDGKLVFFFRYYD
tara:strand:+ start:96 stop:506 length:411 start_codon:yes stop_codon:yes gene_type:complete